MKKLKKRDGEMLLFYIELIGDFNKIVSTNSDNPEIVKENSELLEKSLAQLRDYLKITTIDRMCAQLVVMESLSDIMGANE